MRSAECRHLFVYGTLMSTASGRLGEDMRARLKRDCTILGAATLPGRLYDLGDYPAMVRADGQAAIVHGELLGLSNPAGTLVYLDEYEGIGRGAQAVGEYVRELAAARLDASGKAIEAWVYLYNRELADYRRIPAGRWTGGHDGRLKP